MIRFLLLPLIVGMFHSASPVQDGRLRQLDVLTVPAGQLPDGCRLRPARGETAAEPAQAGTSRSEMTGARVQVGTPAGLPIDTNPWSGDERIAVAAIRGRIDPPQVEPDGPPLHPKDAAAFRRRLADGVASAYAAVYESQDRRQVTVYAVQFETDAGFAQASARKARRPVHQDAATRTLAVVTDYGSPCAPAVTAHIRALFAR
jgi:hypothetical protein